MTKAISFLILALVALGFLASTTINMYVDIKQLRSENQRLARELSQVTSNYEAIAQDLDVAAALNVDLQRQRDTLQAALIAENQARITAESELAVYKGTAIAPSNQPQLLTDLLCPGPEQSSTTHQGLNLSDQFPVSASSLVGVLITIFIMILIDRNRRQKKSRNHLTRLKSGREI